MTSDWVTAQYNDETCRPASALGSVVDHVESFPSLAQWRGEYLTRPLFVSESEIRQFATDLGRLVDLLTSLPQRLFGGDNERFRLALGVDDRRWALIRRLGGNPPPHLGRADMYHDGTSFRLLEFGMASEVGGWDRAGEIPRALLEVDAFADFAERHQLGYTHPAQAAVTALRQAGAAHASGRDPVVALLEWRGGLADYGRTWRTFQEVLRWAGLDILVAEVSDVHERDGGLYLGNTRIDVVYRCFVAGQVFEEPDGLDLVEPIIRAHEAGGVALWTPLSSNLYNNKSCMGMLSDPRHRAGLTAAECALVDRVLPWTRTLSPESVLADEGLIPHCEEHRERLIMKLNASGGGVGSVVGWETDSPTWRAALRSGVAAGAIVQERVIPRREPVISTATGEVQDWQAAYGLFYTPNGYAGTYARALPVGAGSVITLRANPRARTAGIFHHGCPTR